MVLIGLCKASLSLRVMAVSSKGWPTVVSRKVVRMTDARFVCKNNVMYMRYNANSDRC